MRKKAILPPKEFRPIHILFSTPIAKSRNKKLNSKSRSSSSVRIMIEITIIHKEASQTLGLGWLVMRKPPFSTKIVIYTCLIVVSSRDYGHHLPL